MQYYNGGKKGLDFEELHLIYKVTPHFETQILTEKSLCTHYLFNQWLEFDCTSTDTSLVWEKEVIRFHDLDLIFKIKLAL